MPFKISLNSSMGVPYYRQIVNQIIYGITNGILKPGERLPTVRGLAVDLQINLNTVAKAYSELELRGIIDTQQGTGSFVAENGDTIDPDEKQKGIEDICNMFLDYMASLGVNTRDAIVALKNIEDQRNNQKNRKMTDENS